MPWNDDSDNSDAPKANGGPWGGGGSDNGGGEGGSPWNRPGGGKGGGGRGPDLEDQMRKMQERFSRRGGGGRGGRKGPSFGPGGFILLGIVALVAWLATGVVVVDEGERAADEVGGARTIHC